MASTNRAAYELERYLDERNLSPEQLGLKVGLSHTTIYRVLWGQRPSRDTRWRLARELGEDLSTLWPPMPRKRQPGGTRKRAAA
jgi:predicted transcriptional regulator